MTRGRWAGILLGLSVLIFGLVVLFGSHQIANLLGGPAWLARHEMWENVLNNYEAVGCVCTGIGAMIILVVLMTVPTPRLLILAVIFLGGGSYSLYLNWNRVVDFASWTAHLAIKVFIVFLLVAGVILLVLFICALFKNGGGSSSSGSSGGSSGVDIRAGNGPAQRDHRGQHVNIQA
jgi:uncharacterized membrane protein YgcG